MRVESPFLEGLIDEVFSEEHELALVDVFLSPLIFLIFFFIFTGFPDMIKGCSQFFDFKLLDFVYKVINQHHSQVVEFIRS